MFGQLMRSELSRLRYRRRAWGSLIVVMLVGLILPSTWMSDIAEPSRAQQILANVELTRMQLVGACSSCDLSEVTSWWPLRRVITEGIGMNSLVLAFVVFMIIVTYVGADFSSGALSTQLTFTPRRTVLMVARTLACGVLGAVLMAVGVVTMTGVTVVGFLAVNGIASVGTAPGLLNVVLGAVGYGFLLGIIASLGTFMIPSTPLAMGTAVMVLVVTGLADGFGLNPLRAWAAHLMPTRNGVAMVLGQSSSNEVIFGQQGTIITRGDSLLFHLGVIAVLFCLAAVLFERRDIKG